MRLVTVVLAAILTLTTACQTSAAPPVDRPPAASPDCPPSLQCTVNLPAFVDATTPGDGTYNYTPATKDGQQRPIYGLVLHTTEAPTESVVAMSQSAPARSSWNYLLKPDGSVEQSVPLTAVAYNSANRYFNTNYLQIEIVGNSGLCDITSQQYRSLGELGRYLAQRFGFTPNVTTVIGHDIVPGISGEVQAAQHWDPGICFDWPQVYASMGAPAIQPGDISTAEIVTVAPPFGQDGRNDQPLEACTDSSQCQPDRARAYGLNFATVYSAANDQAPLLGDPYVHPDGAPGTAAMNDWAPKAPYGHSYVVAGRGQDWTGLWFNGQVGWVQNKYLAPYRQTTQVATPKRSEATVYGRPMPSRAEFDSSPIPDPIWQAQAVPAALTEYSFEFGQSYPVVPVAVVNDFYEGCDKTDCSAPGDGTVVNGRENYVMIEFGHRYAFVKTSDITVSRR